MKKILFRFLIIFYIFTLIPVFIFADDEVIEDMLDENELKQTVSAPVESLNFPSINARHAILFDRASKTTIYGKNETEKCKMASTTKIMTSIIVTLAATEIPSYISYEVFLSYIGFGLDEASLGKMIEIGQTYMSTVGKEFLFWIPVIVASFTTVVLYVIGQNLGDASDPRTHM